MPRNRRHYRIKLGDAISAHEIAILYGGRSGIQDQNLIESAICRPYNGYYRPIYKKAAALVHSVACNHGFTDGNKRTAFILCNLFLEKSGYRLRETENDNGDLESLILGLATRAIGFEEAVEWFKQYVDEVP
ncbi:type II toxin-antitoxin system death-on-curing family toxin [Shumkonia mesophila]|uniref:type II toxin-antitoxin system death-on-curing family toxin n=1 Tax=Shumkonia mesophila TaxID=2838854 RepID=UPI0029343160|nr:type II toxin-antitoxin system death-on-curing family toxin [Shumkonia mesophila]